MEVKIRIFRGPLTEIMGESEIVVQAEKHAKVIDILKYLAVKYGKPFNDYVFNPKTNDVNSYLLFALNGISVTNIKDIEIEDGDELLILSATGGG
jgi:molybdopterin converting factor small subunit